MTLIDDTLSIIDAREILRPYLSETYAVTPRQISEAEGDFGYSFPRSYRDFLLQVGSGDFRGIEFYGLVPSGNSVEEAANALWLTKSMQGGIGLPPGLFVVGDLGDGAFACLDMTAVVEDECPVILWDPSESLAKNRRILAKSFGDYFMERILSVI